MFRKLMWIVLLVVFVLPSVVGAQIAADTAYIRVLQLANDGTTISLTLADGRTVLTSFAPGSVSDYMPFAAERSSTVTVAVNPAGFSSFTREWSVPPLTPGYHTAAVVGSGRDNTVQLIFIDENTLCEDELDGGSCVILVNNIRNSPALTMIANETPIVQDSRYRQAVVGGAAAGTYLSLRAVDQANRDSVIFRLARKFFEPNVIYIYTLRGAYPAANPADYIVGSVRRVPVDTMTFLRGLTADLQLSDGTTLFATENIVALLELAGYDTILSNPRLALTVFAPTDGAVLESAPDLYQCVLEDPAAMRALILNHILIGSYTPAQLIGAGQLPTMAGTLHSFRAANGEILIDDTVAVSDSVRYPTINGNVYLTDTVLLPDGFVDQFCAAG